MKIRREFLLKLTKHITDGEHSSINDDPNGKFLLLSNKNIKDGKIVTSSHDRKINEQVFNKINKRKK